MSPTRQAFNGATVECSQVFLFSPGENHMSVLFAFPSSSFTHTCILSTSLFFSPTRVLAFRYSLLCSLDTHTCDPTTLHGENDMSVLFALPCSSLTNTYPPSTVRMSFSRAHVRPKHPFTPYSRSLRRETTPSQTQCWIEHVRVDLHSALAHTLLLSTSDLVYCLCPMYYDHSFYGRIGPCAVDRLCPTIYNEHSLWK